MGGRIISLFLLGTTALVAVTPAAAEVVQLNISAQPLSGALTSLALQTRRQIVFRKQSVAGFGAAPLVGRYEVEDALSHLLLNTGLVATPTSKGFVLSRSSVPQARYAALEVQSDVAVDAQPAAEKTSDLEEIIVTAQKRSENLQDVPIAVTAISGNVLAAANVNLVQDLPRLTPGLVINRYSTIVGVYLRGIGTRYTFPGLEATVGNYYDDLYSPRPATAALDFVDIDRVEVLKGPQGTLYGRNTSGGALRVITKDPSDNFEGLAAFTYGRFDEVRADGVVNVPLSENVAARVAASYVHNNGYVDALNPDMHRFEDRNTLQTSAKILAKASDNLTFKLSATYGFKRDWSNALINIFPDLRNVGVALGGTPSPGFYVTAANFPKLSPFKSRYKSWSIAFRSDLELDAFTLSSITGYQYHRNSSGSDVDTTEVSFQNIFLGDTTKTFSQELQAVSSSDGPLVWTAGLYYYKERASSILEVFGSSLTGGSPLQDIQTGPTSGGRYISSYDETEAQSFAPYAQLTYKFSSQIYLNIGGRYTWEKKKVPLHISRFINPPPAPATVIINEPPLDLSFEKFTPKVGLEYHPVDDVMLYAQWSRGFKSGGFNLPQATTPANRVDPETLDSYELGWKTQFDNLRFNGAAFYYDYKDIQIGRSSPGTGSIIVQNAASAEVYGLESELVYAATDRLELAASGAYVHSEFTRFLGDALSANSSSAACLAAGGPVVAAASAACRGFSLVPNTNFAGQPLPLAPRYSGNIRATYKLPLGDNRGSLMFNSLLSYASKFNWGTGPTYFSEPSLVLLSAGLTWSSADEKFELGVSVDNLTNEKYRTAVVRNTTGGYYTPGPPRWWHIKATARF